MGGSDLSGKQGEGLRYVVHVCASDLRRKNTIFSFVSYNKNFDRRHGKEK